ncbi:MAG: hypothetical protein C0469_12910 [Cyanobacteria bacterium DS2.3.42]|nr:hypothetical protein [Cyanobacteria bacterium DS2.3.42]
MSDSQENSIPSDNTSIGAASMSAGRMVGNKYQIVSLIGSGGMGSVYRVQQVFLGKQFALKVLDLNKQNDVSVRRFQQEARTASQLQHPNLIEVHDFGMLGEVQPYLVMDLVEGQTLSDWLKKSGALPPDYVVSLCIQICFGLMYAHEKGVVHRDIKPGNIILLHADRAVTEGSVKIVDFGIAKLTQSEDGEIQALTRTGEIFGSPIYMSPEQCKGTPVDRRSDIYSLGCVVYECLTGTPPFLGDSAMATMLKRLSDEPVSLKEASFGREFPAALESIVRKMLAVEPEDRYSDLGAVIKDLMALERPEHLVRLSPVVSDKEKERRAGDKKFLTVLASISVFSILITSAFDRLFVFPPYFSVKPKEVVDLEKRLAKQRKVLEIKASAEDLELEKVFRLDDVSVPRLKTVSDPAGGTKQILIFPQECGSITINSGPRTIARGEFPLPPNSKITLSFKHTVEPDGVLDRITDVHFERIDYGGNPAVRNETLKILAKIKHLEWVGLRGCDISSLEPLYDARTLRGLEVEATRIQSSEILKVKGLSNLKQLSAGPLKNPVALFNSLAKSKNLVAFNYKGARTDRDYPGKGLEPDAVAALSKITCLQILVIDACPKFNDDSVIQMLPLKNLHTIVIKDCGLTSKSIASFRKFPKLRTLHITLARLTDSDRKSIAKQPFNVTVLEPKLQSQSQEIIP